MAMLHSSLFSSEQNILDTPEHRPERVIGRHRLREATRDGLEGLGDLSTTSSRLQTSRRCGEIGTYEQFGERPYDRSMWPIAVLLAVVGLVMVAAPNSVATAAHSLRISAPPPDRAGRVARATQAIGLVCLGVALVLLAVALFF